MSHMECSTSYSRNVEREQNLQYRFLVCNFV